MNRITSRTFFVSVVGILSLVLAGVADAQPSYSIDAQGPTVASGVIPIGSVGGPINEGDILMPTGVGVLPPPAVSTSALSGLRLPVGAPGAPPVEVDALSYGIDHPLTPNQPNKLITHAWSFSVDEFAVGLPGVPAPSVSSEGALAAGEASADIYGTTTPPGPLPLAFGGNTGLFDGNGGATPFLAPGLNLVEPNLPAPGGLPDPGDNLDAWDIDTPVGIGPLGYAGPVYFSLDSGFADPLEAPGPNFGSAAAAVSPAVGGDILYSFPGAGAPVFYAIAPMLGLDASGPDSDDLDALVLWDNGDLLYQPTTGPYSWLGGATDMVLYSVRRGSAVIGTVDSILGLPIEEGDILVPTLAAPTGPFTPGIFVPAEVLGLATFRSGMPTYQGFADDLDALDVLQFETIIPEPTSLALLAIGLAAVAMRRRQD